MENLEPIVHVTGDNTVGGRYVTWAKNKAKYLLSTGVTIQTVSFPLVDTDNKKKRVNVLITIKINSPFCHIYIACGNASKTTLTSGLSRTEINLPNFDGGNKFIYFYPQPSTKEDTSTNFRPESSLFKTNQIKSVYNVESINFTYDLPYQKTSLGFNVAQQHYLFGNMFTGEMRQIVQLMLASNIEIGYRPFFFNTDGIYTDSKGNKHLINISPNGIFTKKLTYNSYKSNIIDISIPDGVEIDYKNDNKLLNFDFYNNFSCFNQFQGWAFNSNGSKIQNIGVYNNAGFIETDRIEISITDVNGVLSANFTTKESGRLYIFEQDRLLGSMTSDNHPYIPENLQVFNYNYSKKATLVNIPLLYLATTQEIMALNNNVDYKAPISVYFNDKDEEQVVYYNVKKVAKTKTVVSDNTNVTTPSDFFYEDTYNENLFEGWIKEYGSLEYINDNIDIGLENIFNTQLSHGFMVNNDNTTLSIDNCGDLYSKYKVFQNGDNSNPSTKTAFNIQQGNIPLSDYNAFNLNSLTTDSKLKIQQLNYNINTYKDNFIKTLQNQSTTFLITGFSSYKIDKQALNINYFLNTIDTIESVKLNRLNTVTSLLNIDNILPLEIKDIFYSPFLYQVNPDIKTYFDYFNDNISTFESQLDSISTSINSINSSYSVNVRNQFLPLINYFKTFNDSNNFDYNYINTQIANINANIIPALNNYFDAINGIINAVKILFAENSFIDLFIKKIKSYNDIVDNYNSLYFNSICTDIGVKVLNSWTFTTDIEDTIETQTTYYAIQQYNQVNRSIEQSIKNRITYNNSYVFNMYNRCSFGLFKQKNTYTDLNYYNPISNYTIQDNLLKNIQYHSNICETNQLRFYKQDNLYDNSTYETIYANVLPIDNIELNSIEKTVIDYYGNSNNIGAVAFNGTPNQKIIYSNSIYYNNGYPLTEYLLGDLNAQFTNNEINLHNFYDLTDVKNELLPIKYDSIIEKTFNTYNFTEKLSISTNNILDNDKRFITDTSNAGKLKNKNFTKEDKINDYSEDGTTFFVFSKDVFSNGHVINKDFYKYSQEQYFLTNITIYPNINYNSNVYSVNYLGMPFFGKNNGV